MLTTGPRGVFVGIVARSPAKLMHSWVRYVDWTIVDDAFRESGSLAARLSCQLCRRVEFISTVPVGICLQ